MENTPQTEREKLSLWEDEGGSVPTPARSDLSKPAPTRRERKPLCPISRAVGCTRCLAFRVCPLKTVIGDQPKATAPDAKRTGT